MSMRTLRTAGFADSITKTKAASARSCSINCYKRVVEKVPGVKVPLADVRVQRGPATIKREGQVRRIQVSMNVQGRDVGSVVADSEQGLTGLKLPEGNRARDGRRLKRKKTYARKPAILTFAMDGRQGEILCLKELISL
jgi:uncharacterized Zn finger protein